MHVNMHWSGSARPLDAARLCVMYMCGGCVLHPPFHLTSFHRYVVCRVSHHPPPSPVLHTHSSAGKSAALNTTGAATGAVDTAVAWHAPTHRRCPWRSFTHARAGAENSPTATPHL